MENEILTNASSEEMLDTDADYVAAINELKANSVSKTEYQKLRNENKKLLDALVSGQEIDVKPEKPADVNELRKKLFNRDGNLSNLEYVDTALKLRSALMDRGEMDPFLPNGTHAKITSDTYEQAEKVANFLQECVDNAEGDSQLFTAYYQRGVSDPTMPRRGR